MRCEACKKDFSGGNFATFNFYGQRFYVCPDCWLKAIDSLIGPALATADKAAKAEAKKHEAEQKRLGKKR